MEVPMAIRSSARRARLAALVLGVLALALPAGAMAARPEASQSASLSFTGCEARVVADWANQPGRYKRYQVRLVNDENGTQYHAGDGSARAGHVDTTLHLIAGSTKNFRVVLWFLDRDGVVVNGATSSSVSADCQ
jgi:hypothetical protein